jgi:hypothetical protein
MRRIAFVAAAMLTAMIGFTAPSWADEVQITDVPLKEVHQNSLAEDFYSLKECKDVTVEKGQVLWHFVVPDKSFPANPDGVGGNLIDVVAEFDAGTQDKNPPGGVVQNGKGFNILTQDAAKLLNATGKATDVPAETDLETLEMNLSHTCLYVVPDPPDGPTQPPTPTPTPTPTTDVNGEVIAADIVAEELAKTGPGDWWIPLIGGLLLVMTGAGAYLYSQRG